MTFCLELLAFVASRNTTPTYGAPFVKQLFTLNSCLFIFSGVFFYFWSEIFHS